ncbi:hypothetical protein Syun_030410 [Stephania yunnanensis]|uniref:NB-ARC domain-containing protein n=1 Tax=Stephania yunnanensis TaxID=152371 RepID=A0AAP0E7I8_9MAGN
MEEALISSFGSSVGTELFKVFHQRIVLYCNVRREVEEMKRLGEQLNVSLVKADELQARDKDENRRVWMLQVRAAVCEIEVIMDMFNLEERLWKYHSFILRCAFIPRRWARLCRISEKMLQIKPKIEGLITQKEKHVAAKASSSTSSSSSLDPTRRFRRVLHNTKENFAVVGMERAKGTLIGELVKDDVERRVVPIVGMPGSGKTTLAKHVYISDDTKRHFDCRTWADVSQDYNVKGVLLRLLQNVGVVLSDEEKKMAEEEIMGKLNNFLENKRYLVVLDDLWTQQAWDDFEKAFPNGKSGSKIMLTSRNERLAAYADPRSQPVVPEMLSEKESWDLFCNRTFNDADPPGDFPQDLKHCGEKMVKKCGGLPLAIVVLGGLLSTKRRLIHEWESVLRNINWKLGKEERLRSIIDLSYDDLPYNLKSCFLYTSLFPEDFRIKGRRLIGVWIAEGYIRQEGEETLHEAAENALMELISRGMVQVEEMNSLGRVKSCRLHDVLRDFSIVKAKEDGFGEALKANIILSLDMPSIEKSLCPRLGVHIPSESRVSIRTILEQVATYNKHARSILFMTYGLSFIGEMPTFNEVKLLRVLDLEGLGRRCEVPKEIGNLIHLRYLGMRHIYVIGPFPCTIGNLQKLQTLDLSEGNASMPDVLWKMEELRILRLPFGSPTSQLRMDNLKNLHTLKGEVGSWMKKNTSTFTNVVKLFVGARSREEVSEVIAFVDGLASLQCLSIWCGLYYEKEIFSTVPLQFGGINCQRLVKLEFKGPFRARALPNPCEFPPNLTTLKLKSILLAEDPMPTLEKLPNLTHLCLSSSYNGTSMVCKAQGFPRLLKLQLSEVPFLQEWIVEEGAAPHLHHLTIHSCWKLKKVPEAFRFVAIINKDF